MLIADETLERWAERYLSLSERFRRSMTFEQFLAVRLAEQRAAVSLRELADFDRRYGALHAGAVLAIEAGGAHRANGTLVEKLRHRCYQRGPRRYILPKAE